MPSQATMKPLKAPMARPVSRPAPTATGTGAPALRVIAAVMPEIPMTAPTDRSKRPIMNRVIIPIATMRFGAMDVCNEARLLRSRNAGLMLARTTAIRTVAPNVSSSCSTRQARSNGVFCVVLMMLSPSGGS